jgi:hypothetical protein
VEQIGPILSRLNAGRVAAGAFDDIHWIDEERMAVGYWDGQATFVDVVAVDGSRSAVGQGRLIGLMRR